MPGISSKKAIETGLIGSAGVCFVAGELMSRGMNVSWPLLDEGWDLMARNGCRIQVKTARLRHITAWSTEPVYSFHFPKRRFMATAQGKVRERAPHVFSERCDVVALVGLEQKRYWIVPAAEIDVVQCLYVGPSMDRDFESDISHMQDMVNFGFSQAEIGKYYGINQSSVYERLQNAGKPKAGKKFVGRIRAFENTWELILKFGQPVSPEVLAPEGALTERREE